MNVQTNSCLVCIDFINDIVHPKGKVAAKGYSEYVASHTVLERVKHAQDSFRRARLAVIHVRLGFSLHYIEHSAHSPLLGKAKEFRVFEIGAWGTEIAADVAPMPGEVVITKHRVSAFYSTPLDLILRARGINDVYFAGVATDLAVESAVRDAHDRDYRACVLADCCAAACDDDHTRSLVTLSKISRVLRDEEFGGLVEAVSI